MQEFFTVVPKREGRRYRDPWLRGSYGTPMILLPVPAPQNTPDVIICAPLNHRYAKNREG